MQIWFWTLLLSPYFNAASLPNSNLDKGIIFCMPHMPHLPCYTSPCLVAPLTFFLKKASPSSFLNSDCFYFGPYNNKNLTQSFPYKNICPFVPITILPELLLIQGYYLSSQDFNPSRKLLDPFFDMIPKFF